ncbi:MAG TPA: hypothetical protein VNR18_13785 [Hyphomicrobiales bacterium]|nr:hypothetical protein [Hyphomicrobiales bacterium]
MKYKILWPLYFVLSSSTLAQEGHPLTGTWFGSWGDDDNLLTLVMNWNGETVDGIANPGPDSTTLGPVELDSASWSVHLQMTLNDADKGPVDFRVNGRLDDVLTSTRRINGTWEDSLGRSGPITISRQVGP